DSACTGPPRRHGARERGRAASGGRGRDPAYGDAAAIREIEEGTRDPSPVESPELGRAAWEVRFSREKAPGTEPDRHPEPRNEPRTGLCAADRTAGRLRELVRGLLRGR